MKKTKVLYLDQPDVFQVEACVLSTSVDAGGHTWIELDQTPMYPKGGGQPADSGTIVAGDHAYSVIDVVQEPSGRVVHRVAGTINIQSGDSVRVVVDEKVRLMHSRIHTAGELLVPAMQAIGYPLKAVGAIHYVDTASVTFEGVIPEERRPETQAQLQTQINRMITAGYGVTIVRTGDQDKVREICGFVPEYVDPGELIRIVQVWGGYGRPCRGTHVDDISKIGAVEIIKMKCKQGQTRVSYRVRD